MNKNIEELASQFINEARLSAYGPGEWHNELEGDFGTWEDWKQLFIKHVKNAMNQSARTYLTNLYLDNVNNYLTLEKFAEHHGLTPKQAMELILVAQHINSTKHPEM